MIQKGSHGTPPPSDSSEDDLLTMSSICGVVVDVDVPRRPGKTSGHRTSRLEVDVAVPPLVVLAAETRVSDVVELPPVADDPLVVLTVDTREPDVVELLSTADPLVLLTVASKVPDEVELLSTAEEVEVLTDEAIVVEVVVANVSGSFVTWTSGAEALFSIPQRLTPLSM